MYRQPVLLRTLAGFALTLAGGLALLPAGDTPHPADPYAGRVAKGSDDWKKTLQRMQLAKGVRADLWAAEPHVANIIAFDFDERGRCYVAETFRLHKGVTDNRGHMNWLDDELAARTVADRIAMYKKYLGKNFAAMTKEQDRVRLVEDTNGDGKADRATVFAGGFNRPEDGLGSGVLARKGKVWYACIPDLWLLQDTTGDGRADVKKSLHTGYGVHVAFLGHDLHGLKIGPDGKLYFTVGDRGLHVETEGRTLAAPDTGSVLRCNLDGSELEIFATGLRNPQELAFDEFGNLFTGDNNADGGDQARWVHLVEGGDSGWRIGYQYLPGLGPWNAEKLWKPLPENTANYLLPPLANLGNGPSGLTYHPGVTLLPERYQKHFFLSDFRGSGGGSGVHAFTVKPKGASFEVADREQFVWSVLATDADFAPDGGFYVSDWVEGWGMPNKGRIWKLADPDRAKDPAVAEVKKLLAEDLTKRPTEDLTKLLGHADMRVRQEAQFALAERGAVEALAKAAKRGEKFARLHAVWGLGQVGRKNPKAYETLPALAKADDADVRAQALKVLGEGRVAAGLDAVIAGLKDAEPRVRFFAAQAAGKLAKAEAAPAVLELLRANADADPYLRHAGVMALAGIGAKTTFQQAAADPSPSVRLGALLALRRLQLPEVARFLKDADPKLVLEAARAIYDTPIAGALPQLAELTKPGSPVQAFPKDVQERVLHRALTAHYRLGKRANAEALARFAARSNAPDKLREEALALLSAWEKPSGRDKVVGLWRPLPERPGTDVAEALRPALAGVMTGPDKVRAAGAKLAARHGMKEIGPTLRELVADKSRPAGVRVETLRALEALKDAQLEQVAAAAEQDADPRLRHEARRIRLAKADPQQAVAALGKVLEKGDTIERQGALALLADVKSPRADQLLGSWVHKLLEKQAPPALHLDILQAARQRKSPELKALLAKVEAARPKNDALAAYRPALVGGDAEAGRKIFFEKSEVSCLRCHKVNGTGGEVGPDLTGIGKKYPRDYLLEALVDPNKQIAKGYESVVLVLLNGQTKTGILRGEDGKEVRLMTAEGQVLRVPMDEIDERQRGPSAMPNDLHQKMSPAELRDLIEYLARLKE